jgi:hypothetical protein
MGRFPPDGNGSREPLLAGKFFTAILRREGRGEQIMLHDSWITTTNAMRAGWRWPW